MKRFLTSAVAVGAAAVLSIAAAPSFEELPHMATDIAGDANALNGQGIDDTPGSTSTGPLSYGDADILGARIVSLYDTVIDEEGVATNVMTGLEFRTEMANEPAELGFPVIHRFMGSTGGCEFWIQAYTGTATNQAHGAATVRLFDAGCGLEVDPDAALGTNETVSGDWLTYSFDAETSEMVVTLDLEQGDERLTSRIVRGDYYTLDAVANRGNTGVATVPVIDELVGGGYALLGSDIPEA